MSGDASGPLTGAWRTNAAITRELLDAIPAAHLADRYSERTRTVGAQFAHLHYVRVKNLKERGGAGFVGELDAFERGAEPGKRELRRALDASGEAMARLVASFEEAGAVRAWGGNTFASYVSYLIAHEAHHRALAIVSLRLSGHKLPPELTNGLWYSWRRKK